MGEFDDGYANNSSGNFNQWMHRDLDMGILRELKDVRTPEGYYGSWNHNNPGEYLNGAAGPRNFWQETIGIILTSILIGSGLFQSVIV